MSKMGSSPGFDSFFYAFARVRFEIYLGPYLPRRPGHFTGVMRVFQELVPTFLGVFIP